MPAGGGAIPLSSSFPSHAVTRISSHYTEGALWAHKMSSSEVRLPKYSFIGSTTSAFRSGSPLGVGDGHSMVRSPFCVHSVVMSLRAAATCRFLYPFISLRGRISDGSYPCSQVRAPSWSQVGTSSKRQFGSDLVSLFQYCCQRHCYERSCVQSLKLLIPRHAAARRIYMHSSAPLLHVPAVVTAPWSHSCCIGYRCHIPCLYESHTI